MPVEQVRFLGASVTSFNSVVGWNGQVSTVEVSLVEDIRNGDAFLPPLIGTPVYFVYEGFRFGGLLQHMDKQGNSGGSPLYNLTIVDPRTLLNGVKVILDGYQGSVLGIPNLVNVFGYYESNLFGSSGSNGGGMQWSKIRAALNATVAVGSQNGYGGPIQYQNNDYGLDISNLPDLPAFYRISGSPTLMEIIQNVCDAGGCDFFVELVGMNITFYTISRVNIPDQGVITNFITQTPGAVSKQIGLDAVNEVTGKFLVGGKKREMWFQNYGTQQDGTEGIWWFWGYDNDGNAIIGKGYSDLYSDSHTFNLDSRAVLINGVGSTYPSSIGEMRAALVSQDEWERFLICNNNNAFVIDLNGTSTAQMVPITSADGVTQGKYHSYYNYPHNGVNNPHFGKASILGLQDSNNANAAMFITNQQITKYQYNWGRMRMTFPGRLEDQTQALYDLVRTVAEENYGTKILVSLPSIAAAFDVESNRPIFSTVPVDGGFLGEEVLTNAAAANLIPLDLNAISEDQTNLIYPLVRFDNVGILDFSQVPEDKMFFSANGSSIFIICSIASEVIFFNWGSLTQPRVVLQLPGRVTFANTQYFSQTADVMFLKGITQAQGKSITDAQFLEDLSAQYPQEIGFQFAALPGMAAVPLESNIDRYGPWFAQGAVGAMDFEEDDSLTPWNYGTYSNLNLAGNAKVTENIANLQTIESGSIEFPGVPAQNLGSQLLSTGPYVTNIQVTIGPGGCTTNYRMEMWKPKFGTLNKSIVDTVTKMGKLYNMYRRNFLEKIKINRKGY